MKSNRINLLLIILVVVLSACVLFACDSGNTATVPSGDGGSGDGGSGDGGGGDQLPSYSGTNLGELLYSRYMLGSANLSSASFAAAFKAEAAASGAAESLACAGPDGDGLVIDGDNYSWTDFTDYSNFGDFFSSTVIQVEAWVKEAKASIAWATSNITEINKWVGVSTERYKLTYDAKSNSTILYKSFSLGENTLSLRKYVAGYSEDGIPKYEIYAYEEGEEFISHGSFISEGTKFEISTWIDNDQAGISEIYISADSKPESTYAEIQSRYDDEGNLRCGQVNTFEKRGEGWYSKGWDVIDVNNAVYSGSVEELGDVSLSVTGADMANDIMNVTLNLAGTPHFEFELKLNGFTGVKALTETATEEELADGEKVNRGGSDPNYTYGVGGDKTPDIVLNKKTDGTNNDVVTIGTKYAENKLTYAEGNVVALSQTIGEAAYVRYYPTILLSYEDDDLNGAIDALRTFMKDTGIVCKYDFDVVLDDTVKQYSFKDQEAQYFTFRGQKTSTFANMKGVIEGEFDALTAEIDDMKANESDKDSILAATAQPKLDAKIATLPDFSEYVSGKVTIEDGKIITDNLKFELPDGKAENLVFMDDKDYTILVSLEEKKAEAAGDKDADYTVTKILDAKVVADSKMTYDMAETPGKGFTFNPKVTFDIPKDIADGDYTVNVALAFTETKGEETIVSPVSKFSEVDIALKGDKTKDEKTLENGYEDKYIASDPEKISVKVSADKDMYPSDLELYKIDSSEVNLYDISKECVCRFFMGEYGIYVSKTYYRANAQSEWVIADHKILKVGEYKVVGCRFFRGTGVTDETMKYMASKALEYYLTVELNVAP